MPRRRRPRDEIPVHPPLSLQASTAASPAFVDAAEAWIDLLTRDRRGVSLTSAGEMPP
jgi:hypothetical protein